MKRIWQIAMFIYWTSPTVWSQEITWPGDVNNNGKVTHVDFLYMASIMGETGPNRAFGEQGDNWEAKEISDLWSNSFANGVNYAYADCNGSGMVTENDRHAINDNYNLEHGVVTPDIFTLGVEGEDASLFLGDPSEPIFEGGVFHADLHLGKMDKPINNFLGIAFTIRYDKDIVENINVDVDDPNTTWISSGPGPSNIYHFDKKFQNDGFMVVTIVRDEDNIIPTGFGQIGELFIVIEDHVFNMSEPSLESFVLIEDVLLLNDNMEDVPIFADSLFFTILNDDILHSGDATEKSSIKVFPTLARQEIWIDSSNQFIKQIRLYDIVGNKIKDFTINDKNKTSIVVENIPNGMYLIEVSTNHGKKVEKVLIQH